MTLAAQDIRLVGMWHVEQEMTSRQSDLSPHFLRNEDAEMHKVSEPGWYAFDDNFAPSLGSFSSRAECEEAISREAT